jgi:hypothetical protein
MRKLTAIAIVAALGAGGYAAYRRVVSPTSGGGNNRSASPAASAPSPLAKAPEPGAIAGALPAPPSQPAAPADSNVLTLDLGARVDQVSGTALQAAPALIDGRANSGCWQAWIVPAAGPLPKELVFTFFAGETVLLSSVVVNPRCGPAADWAKDVELWASAAGAAGRFEKIADARLDQMPDDQAIEFEPHEVAALKLVVRSNHGGREVVSIGRVKAIEASRPGYTPLLVSHPELAHVAASRGGPVAPSSPTAPVPQAAPAGAETSTDVCGPIVPVPPEVAPAIGESRRVLVIASEKEQYPPVQYRPTGSTDDGLDIYGRIAFSIVRQQDARPALLLPAASVDTVVLAQVCDIRSALEDAFKRRLVEWVGEGHKLIIHDSDRCGGTAERPDYSFLPYRFATNNPGRQGASSDALWFVEENTLGNSRRWDPAYLDIDAWLGSRDGNRNELGDSNTITQYDSHWCGHLFGRNQQSGGFLEAYAHYGRGLIIYNGFDIDQADGTVYRRLVTRELVQPFDPDGLPCTGRLSDFVITTENRLRSQALVPGRAYPYPLTLLSNQGFNGQVALSVVAAPNDSTIGFRIDPPTLSLGDTAKAMLTVTTSPSTPVSVHRVAVRGTDAAGRASALCLELTERRTGGIQVVGAFPHPAKPTRNLLIDLDLSGSMNEALEKSTRIAVARRVLREVLAKIPDDFSVGLRLYGHRYGSRQKETCTDSELAVPVVRLDRQRIMSVVDSKKPRGETPLVYSVLQGASDLKSAGGGSIILITDGEESCGGDPRKAVEQLKASGVDLTLNIVGFTITGKHVQTQLEAFAEGTGGHYYSAQGADALSGAILAAAIDKMQFTVFNAAGRTVAGGVSGDAPAEVVPGDYRVVIQAGSDRLVAEHVKIAQGADVVLQVVLDNGRFAIRR